MLAPYKIVVCEHPVEHGIQTTCNATVIILTLYLVVYDAFLGIGESLLYNGLGCNRTFVSLFQSQYLALKHASHLPKTQFAINTFIW